MNNILIIQWILNKYVGGYSPKKDKRRITGKKRL